MKRAALLLFASTLLTGCIGIGQSEFSCQGFTDGVSCKSAREVYQDTEYAEFIGPEGSKKIEDRAKIVANSSPVDDPAVNALRQLATEGAIPIRMPEQVQRTWIAPWEDESGNLHMANMIYTEVEKRKWVVGAQSSNPAARLTPLDVRSRNSDTPNNRKKQDLSNFNINLPEGVPNNEQN